MKKIVALAALFLCLAPLRPLHSQEVDVFTPIGKYMQNGDYDNLSAWFADNLELDIFGETNTCSRNQARLIMKKFFEEYTPKRFTVMHKSSQATMRYAVAEFAAGGELFRILLYVNGGDGRSYIEQIVVSRHWRT